MSTNHRARAFHAMWWTTGLLILYWSLKTTVHAHHAGHGNAHVALLGAVEALSAILFLIPRTMRVGAIGLLGTFAIAFGMHALQDEFRGELLLYASVVSFVLVHDAQAGIADQPD